MDLLLKQIATFESCYKDKFAVPRQPGLAPHAWGKIHFEKFVQPELALEGIEGYSHLWLIFTFHQNTNLRYHAKVHPPRLQGKTIGALATRSPHRPNNIGLSLVKIYKVEKDSIVVMGADLVDGTPIYDIKPYLAQVEAVTDAQDGWATQAEDQLFSVKFGQSELESEQVNQDLKAWQRKLDYPFLQELITETLRRDPRPQVYKEDDYKLSHAFRLFEGDIHFTVDDSTRTITINRILA